MTFVIVMLWHLKYSIKGFSDGSDSSKQSACNAGDAVSNPGLGRSPGEGNGYPLQYSCLENSMREEPGGLQTMQSQRVKYDWAANIRQDTDIIIYRFIIETRAEYYFFLLMTERNLKIQKIFKLLAHELHL